MRIYTTPLSASDLSEIASALASGAVALIPTDTVYGVAAHPANSAGVAKLFALKHRNPANPIPLLAASTDAVAESGLCLGGAALAAARKFWPGPLTIVLDGFTPGTTEGVRVPDSATAREICAAGGGLLRCTSANESGDPPALDAASAAAALPGADILIDGGDADIGVASTVARFNPDGSVKVFREGVVTKEQLESF